MQKRRRNSGREIAPGPVGPDPVLVLLRTAEGRTAAIHVRSGRGSIKFEDREPVRATARAIRRKARWLSEGGLIGRQVRPRQRCPLRRCFDRRLSYLGRYLERYPIFMIFS